MNGSQSWMLYGASGYTGSLIARHAHERGHRRPERTTWTSATSCRCS
jgi:short subunit dehydrogenase-like uncharacterized protein